MEDPIQTILAIYLERKKNVYAILRDPPFRFATNTATLQLNFGVEFICKDFKTTSPKQIILFTKLLPTLPYYTKVIGFTISWGLGSVQNLKTHYK